MASVVKYELDRSPYSQAALALATGISTAQVSRIFSGKKHMDLDQLEAMCRILRVSPTSVVERAESLSVRTPNLRAVADEDSTLVQEMEDQQESH